MHISFSGVRDRVHAMCNVVNYHKEKAFQCMNVIPCTTSCCTFPNIQRNKQQIHDPQQLQHVSISKERLGRGEFNVVSKKAQIDESNFKYVELPIWKELVL